MVKRSIAKLVASATSLCFLWAVWRFLDGLSLLGENGNQSGLLWILGGVLLLFWLAIIREDHYAPHGELSLRARPYLLGGLEEEEE